MQDRIVADVKKIAVLQAKAVGDFIVTTPSLDALKCTYPSAELVYLGKPWHHAFLSGRPSPIDRVVIIPPSDGVRDEPDKKGSFARAATRENPDDLSAFFSEMRAERFDIAIHLQGDGKGTNPFLNRLGAGLTVGMRNKGAEAIDRSIPYVHYQAEVLRNLEIVSLVGARTSQPEPRLHVTGSDLAEAAAFLGARRRPFIVLHPGADDPRRMWPAEEFAQVGDALAAQGYQIIITGTAQEETIVGRVVGSMAVRPLDACGRLSLGGLAGLLSLSALVIGNDTGPLHLARAVGTPTVGIYWLPNVLNWGPLLRRVHRTAIAFDLHCPGCGVMPTRPWPFEPITDRCDHPFSFVHTVATEDVVHEAVDLLEARGFELNDD